MVNYLNKGLQDRKDKIQDAVNYLNQTKELFQKFGQQELTHVINKFDDIHKSLDSGEEVKLVVIGEFSRGKSTLVNALLNILLLRSAQEATTAINTFVRKLPEGVNQRFIRIHFQDGNSQDIQWLENDKEILEKWSTELDTTHASARQQLDRIEIFTSHPLLDQGLVLIDTPGLQSVIEYHEGITRRAIDEAHIAIWVQSTQQLGGNATEWNFLSKTIRKNFNKFLTVVNMWDSVLEPQDPFDQQKTLEERETQKYQHVKNNFKKNLEDVSENDLEIMTNSDHLIGVSAAWALSQDENKKSQSNIDKLSQRISEMLSTGEALDEIYKKPLHTLVTVQNDLIIAIKDELEQLESNQTITERQRESEKLDLEIKNLQQELKMTNDNAKIEHDRVAQYLISDLKEQLILPLTDLKNDIEVQVSIKYIESQINQGNSNIQLPSQLQQQYENAVEDVNNAMQQQGKNIDTQLSDLRVDYAKELESHAAQLKNSISGINFSLPSLDLSFDVDFSAINDYFSEQTRLEQEILKKRQDIEKLENDILNNQASPMALENAKNALLRAERGRASLGGRPQAQQITRTREEPSWGIFGWLGFTKQVNYVDYDDTNVLRWEREYSEAQKAIANRESFLEKIQREEEEKGRKRMSSERIQQRYEQEVAKVERQRKRIEDQVKASRQQLIEDTHQRLIQNTSGVLNRFIRQLQEQVQPHIQQIFDEQLKLLKMQVKEQLEEPLNAKLKQRKQIQELIEQGQSKIDARKQELSKGLSETQTLVVMTQDALESA
ncbi:dynamin family protein [Acinetobacter sp. YH12128]|uniref:dynamin family protein n=1 Tax=Acinetobacter sp. YH12128 TaxID=2601113 RepID=UPI0015D16387